MFGTAYALTNVAVKSQIFHTPFKLVHNVCSLLRLNENINMAKYETDVKSELEFYF